MDFFIISVVALTTSLLTLFSGFGLGTLLMPIIALFFPIEVAITITAIVHFANNGFKVLLIGKHASLSAVIKFGLPAAFFALLGALFLTNILITNQVITYHILSYEFTTSMLGIIIGSLILLFVVIELAPFFKSFFISKKYLPVGGAISGFLGGLSGHQGAFRSMFLLRAGLSKEQFIATGVLLAVLVDLNRLVIYGWHFGSANINVNWWLVLSACISAFVGTYFGKKLLTKVTIDNVQKFVSVTLVFIAIGLITGTV